MSLRDSLRIMIVDDTATGRALLLHGLEAIGLRQVTAAENGVDALGALAQDPPHLILSDQHMPGMEGLDLLEALRARDDTRDVGFILVTATLDEDLLDRGRRLGLNNVLQKPFQPETLRSVIEAVTGPL